MCRLLEANPSSPDLVRYIEVAFKQFKDNMLMDGVNAAIDISDKFARVLNHVDNDY